MIRRPYGECEVFSSELGEDAYFARLSLSINKLVNLHAVHPTYRPPIHPQQQPYINLQQPTEETHPHTHTAASQQPV